MTAPRFGVGAQGQTWNTRGSGGGPLLGRPGACELSDRWRPTGICTETWNRQRGGTSSYASGSC